jgi:hypothetical protein
LCYNWEQVKQSQTNYYKRTDKCCTKESKKSSCFYRKTAQQSFIFKGLTLGRIVPGKAINYQLNWYNYAKKRTRMDHFSNLRGGAKNSGTDLKAVSAHQNRNFAGAGA